MEDWEVWDLERAMDRVAELVQKTRDETFVERLGNGKLVNMTTAIFSLGGATLDNEWSHDTAPASPGWGPGWGAGPPRSRTGPWPSPTAS